MSDEFLDPRLAERLTRAARAAQALSETLWEALLQELADPRSERVAELSKQLGEVAAVVASLAQVDARAREPEEPAEPRVERATYEEPRAGRARSEEYEKPQGPPVAPPAPPWEPPETEMPPVSPVLAVLIDELAAAETPTRAGARPEPARESAAPPLAGAQPARPDTGGRPREGDPPRSARPEIEIRDERSAEGPAAWIDSIGAGWSATSRTGRRSRCCWSSSSTSSVCVTPSPRRSWCG